MAANLTMSNRTRTLFLCGSLAHSRLITMYAMQQCVRGQTESKIFFRKSYIQFFMVENTYIYVHVRINFIGAQKTERKSVEC